MIGATNENEMRVLICAPTARDAEVTHQLLSGMGIPCLVCQGIGAILEHIAIGAGAVLTTEEAIVTPGIEKLLAALKAQPTWSEVPFVVLMRGAAQSPLASRVLQALGNVTLLERPAPLRTVASAVQAALRERRRQYQIRNQMAEIERLLRQAQVAQTEAERASRMKDEFLATVSHELRTPLSAILLWARMLESDAIEPTELKDAIRAIVRSAEAQQQLIEDLLDMARIMTGKMRLEMSRINPAVPVLAAIETVRPTADLRQVEIETRINHDIGHVLGDPNRLQQVAWNLLTNAVKFTARGGHVLVTVTGADERIRITVSDTGKGIGPEFLPHVFERFRQADASITRSYGGLGLGLSIVRELVELHDGTVQADSDGAGRGARFTIELPRAADDRNRSTAINRESVADHSLAQASEKIDPPMALLDRHVLLVEDEPETRRALTRVLQSAGARVIAVGAADAAVDRIQSERPDVLISDIGLPGQDGYSLIQRVRRLSDAAIRNVPALALTAYARREDREHALAAGFNAYAAKPINPDELIARVASLACTATCDSPG